MAQPTHALVPSAVGFLDMPRRDTGPTTDPLRLAVAGFLSRYRGTTFQDYKHEMTRPNASRLIRTVAATAVLPSTVTPHSFRRAFCSTLLASGASLPDVQAAMRHASPTMTMVYDRRSQTPARDASHQLNAVLAGMRR